MAKYCEYYVYRGGIFSSEEKCNASGEEKDVPNGYSKWYCCDENTAYSKCPKYKRWYIVAKVGEILSINPNSSYYSNLWNLKDKLNSDENYDRFMTAYDAVGPKIADDMGEADDSISRAKDAYIKLDEIVDSMDEKDMSIAKKKYVMFTLRLVAQYGLQKEYRKARDGESIPSSCLCKKMAKLLANKE